VRGAGWLTAPTLTAERKGIFLDAQRRLWQELPEDETRNPLRHFAVDKTTRFKPRAMSLTEAGQRRARLNRSL